MRRAVIGIMLAALVFGTVAPGSPRGAWAQTLAQAALAQAAPAQTAPAPAPVVPVPAAPAPVASAPPAVPTPGIVTQGIATSGIATSGIATPGIATSGIATSGKPAPGKPTLSIDLAVLPPLPPVVPADERRQAALIATGAGAAIGILLADILTGGVLLAPLGLPSASTMFSAEPAAAAAAPAAVVGPTYSVAQQLLAGVASFAAAVGGGYVGSYVARAHPDLVGLPE